MELSYRLIYADNAATTPVSNSVLQAMLPYLSDIYGNPSSVYGPGREARQAVEDAREKVAKAIGAEHAAEIFFTAGGSESDNWAIKGAAYQLAKKGKKHLITSAIEHHAVLHSMEALEKEGFSVTYLPVDEQGKVRLEDVRSALREDTALVSIMYANNEIGTIQDITAIGALCREAGVWFHTDAVQAAGIVPIDVVAENIDMLSISAHKLNGPKGVGALYVRRGVVLKNIIDGGAQERGRRAGTENVPGIVGFGKAISDAVENMAQRAAHEQKLRDYVINFVESNIPKCRLNGSRESRLPGNVNFSFAACEGESLLLFLDMMGICASSGSACTSGSLDPSHVLLAIGLSHEVAHGSLRLSFGVQNTMEEAEYICSKLQEVVAEVRHRSPLWNENE